MEYPEPKRAAREQYERFRPSVVLIEDKASGTQQIQELLAEGLHAVTRYRPQSDKVMRLHAQTAIIENGVGTPACAHSFRHLGSLDPRTAVEGARRLGRPSAVQLVSKLVTVAILFWGAKLVIDQSLTVCSLPM